MICSPACRQAPGWRFPGGSEVSQTRPCLSLQIATIAERRLASALAAQVSGEPQNINLECA